MTTVSIAELAPAHGLKPDEYQRILDLIGREPTLTELGIFSAMWNEHCSYKSSKVWLKTLPVDGPQVICGPGENAGIVDIGDGDAVVFKMESHNHPSYIEPYQGAATGAGGILRDVFTMGARPIAAMNSLFFGEPSHPKTKHLVSGVVAGIGGYCNSFGVPTIGGSVLFDKSYNGNCLVNAFAAGLVKSDEIFYSAAKGVGLPIVYLGSKTGRDGVGGATMASAAFDDDTEEKRPTVQVGDPFAEKRLLEACLELMKTGAVIAIQDMGAAGLTCSAVEMGAKGNLGIHLILDQVPCREDAMTAYEMMLSESQERMLMVLDPEKTEVAEEIFRRWELDFAVVGKTTDDLRFKVEHKGHIEADLPIKQLGDDAPEYNRPFVVPEISKATGEIPSCNDVEQALKTLIGGLNGCSRHWVFEQYDTFIGGETILRPGGDAGVVQVSESGKGLAMTADVTPRYVLADPFEGGKQAVAETWRNLTATGATPLAITDNLNFGNPEVPEIMGQFAQAIKGIGEACRALSYPVVSGNVSLYNETAGDQIKPTPTIGAVGVIDHVESAMTIGLKEAGNALYLVGEKGRHLHQSAYAVEVCDRADGPPPTVDLEREKANGDFVRNLICDGIINACHDISDGGLLVAICEMAMAGQMGVSIKSELANDTGALFGEDQARYIVSLSAQQKSDLESRALEHNISIEQVGDVGGSFIQIGDDVHIPLAQLAKMHKSGFDNLMGA